MRRGYLPAAAVIILAAITLAVAVVIYFNRDLILKIKKNQQAQQGVISPSSKVSATPSPSPEATANWKTYTSQNKIFTLKYPLELTATAQGEGVLSTVSPWNDTFMKSSDYRVEFSLGTKAQGENLKNFADRTIKQQSGQISNQNLLSPDSQKSLMVNNHQALWYVGNLGPATKHVEVYIQRNETSVVIVQLWDNSQPPTTEHQTTLNQILSTFQFTD